MKTILVAALLLLSAGAASADTIWNYTGNSQDAQYVAPNTNPCGCSLSGSVVFDTSWDALSWSFTDGQVTLTNLNSTGSFNPFWYNNPATPFYTWRVFLTGVDGSYLFSENYDNGFEATDGGNGWYVQGNQGLWLDPPAATPEPGVLLLLGLALLFVVAPMVRFSGIGKRA